MNRQRKVVITTTYNDLGIIVDTKAEELDLSVQPNLQPTCDNLETDTISRQEAIDALSHMCSEDENGITVSRANVNSMLKALPSVQPDHIVGVSKKDDENGDDLIRREDALMSLTGEWTESRDEILSKAIRRIKRLPSVQPESFDPRADVYYLAEKIGIHQLYALVVELRGEPESCGGAVSRQKLKDGFKEMCDLNCPYTEKQQHLMCGSCMMGTAFDVLEATPSVQPEQNDAEFWRKRSDEYEKMFCDLYWRMMNGVKFESMQFDKNGITLKMKEPSQEDNT